MPENRRIQRASNSTQRREAFSSSPTSLAPSEEARSVVAKGHGLGDLRAEKLGNLGCLQEALRALLARRELAVSAGAIFFNNTIIGIAVNYFSPKFPPPNRRGVAGRRWGVLLPRSID